MPPTQAFDGPVSISSVYNDEGLPTLMTVVYAIAVFAMEKLDARLSKFEVVLCPATLACPRAKR